MSLRKQILARVAQGLTSPRLRTIRRSWFEFKRGLLRRPRTLDVFLRAADPYSYLLACRLPDFAREHALRIRLHTIAELPADMNPRPELLESYSRLDACRVAQQWGIEFPEGSRPPAADLLRAATALLLQCESEPSASGLDRAARILGALWKNDRDFFAQLPRTSDDPDDATQTAALRKNEELLRKMGHYNSAMIFYGGEWYWGVDRLGHLERRLSPTIRERAPAANVGVSFASTTQDDASRSGGAESATPQTLELYFSFRSPYSYLALGRTFALADRYHLDLQIKPVLPMVMRGLKVPRAKRFYLLKDAGREAERNGIPFGRVADPLGIGVERCMAGLACARKYGREREYLLAAAEMIWSEGVDVASDRGLAAVVERAGLDWSEFQNYLSNEDWREAAERNQEALYGMGAWGVPSFRLNSETVVWGQDRFEILEAAILKNRK